MKKYLLTILSFLFYFNNLIAQTQLITGGGFETSGTWNSPSYFQYGVAPNPNSGSSYAYLADMQGYPANNISGVISQDFYIPAGTASLDIEYFFRVSTTEPTISNVYDFCTVILENVANTSINIPLATYSNLDATSFYQNDNFFITNASSGQWWRIKIFGSNDAGYPSVFRFDDISIIANPPQTCITWAGNNLPVQVVDTSMEHLCANNIISNYQDINTLNNDISKIEIARCIGKALFGNSNNIQFLDNFPNVYPEMDMVSNIDDKRYLKMMHYLEYQNIVNPSLGTDNIAPFTNNSFFHNYWQGVKRSDAVKAILEAINQPPSMVYYDPTNSSFSPLICDMSRNHKNLGWVQQANLIGFLNNITSTCSGSSIYFGGDNNITYTQFYILLNRALYHLPTTINYNDFYVPPQFELKYADNVNSIERGVINEYSNNSFSIPAGTYNLSFNHSYHSNKTEFPILGFENDLENNYLKTKLEPFGAGWTHDFNMYIRYFDSVLYNPKKLVIYWPDGSIQSFLTSQLKYETKNVRDKLTIDSMDATGQLPIKVTIRKGRTDYIFRMLDPYSYNTLVISEIKNASNDKLNFNYQNGTGPNSTLLVKVLQSVQETYSGRHINFTYWNGTNYIKDVKDQLNRSIQFFPNQWTHDLDSCIDAKGQKTKYTYFETAGTHAYRTHLLGQITYPKGNYTQNNYNRKKAYQINQQSSVTTINSNPNYQNPWTTQSAEIKVSQNNQTIKFNYEFDELGNTFKEFSPIDSIVRTFDTATGYLLTEKDITKGFKTVFGYDANGFENKKVIIDSIYQDSIKYEIVNNNFGEPIEFKDYNDPTTSGYTTTSIDRNPTGFISSVRINAGTGGEVKHQFGENSHGQMYNYISPTLDKIEFDYYPNGDLKYKKIKSNTSLPDLIETYNYDAIGRLASSINTQGENSKVEYDANDNVTKTKLDTLGLNLITSYGYDANDNNISITSPKGNATTHTFDFNTDKLIKIFDGANTIKYSYNQDNSIDSFITKNNHLFKYLYYDSINFPNTQFKGMLLTDGINQFSYHPQTRNLRSVVNNNTGKQIEFGYWNAPNNIKRGKFDKLETIRTYGFVTCLDRVYYEYNEAQQPSLIAAPDFMGGNCGYRYFYDYTTKKVSLIEQIGTYKVFIKYNYIKDGRIDTKVLGNGDTIFNHYDSYNRVDSIWAKNKQNKILYTLGATLDSLGRHIRENTQIFFTNNADSTLPTIINGNTVTSSYNAQNRITNENGNVITNDANGNMISVGSNISATWNEYSQMKSYTKNSSTSNIEYDPLGHRRIKDSTFYFVDVANTENVLLETDLSCNPKSMYVWGDDGLVCRVDPITNNIFYYHFDFRGSVVCITDTSGSIVKLYKYDDFGTIYKDTGSITWNNPYRYIGKFGVEFDNNDLYYMKARYYIPSQGRFLGEDPVFGTNLFTYCGNDPVNRIDPTGNEYIELNTLDKNDPNWYINVWKASMHNTKERTISALRYATSKENIEFVGTLALLFATDGAYSSVLSEEVIATKSTLKIGQKMHKLYKIKDQIKGVAIKEYNLIKGIRPDFVNLETRTIYELKPNNSRSINEGWRQLQKYKKIFEDKFGGTWNIILDTY